MLSRLQRMMIGMQLLVALLWMGFWALHGRPVLSVVGALLIGFSYAVLLAAEFGCLYVVQKAGGAPRPTLFRLLRAWWRETCTAPGVFFWRQPFMSEREPDHLPEPCRGRTGVVLVHGLVCNRGFWNPWMSRLRAASIPFVAPNLEPVFGSIDDYVDAIEAAVAKMEQHTGMPVVLVGHSMGGMAIRAWHARAGNAERVKDIVTIGSPHRGTWLARFSYSPNGRQMRTDSQWLQTLSSREAARGYGQYTCFYGHCDNIVFPSDAATLPGARNVHVPDAPHVRMAFEPQVMNAVMSML